MSEWLLVLFGSEGKAEGGIVRVRVAHIAASGFYLTPGGLSCPGATTVPHRSERFRVRDAG